MEITVVFLGGSRGQTGRDRQTLEVEPGCTIRDVAERVAAEHPGLAPLLASVRWARNFEFAAPDEEVRAGDEIALLPPVAGGAPHAGITSEPLNAARVMARVASPQFGATVVFVGTVRDHSRGEAVTQIEYETYQPMAERQLERIAEACSSAGAQVAIEHRQGLLPVGESSVVIAASAAHREEAFAACRAALERIKTDVPIFKREQRATGEVWVGWGGG